MSGEPPRPKLLPNVLLAVAFVAVIVVGVVTVLVPELSSEPEDEGSATAGVVSSEGAGSTAPESPSPSTDTTE